MKGSDMMEENISFIKEKISQLYNNTKIKENLLKNNKQIYMPKDYPYGKIGIVPREDYFLMMQLGIPIGAVKVIDLKGNDVYEWMDIPCEETHHLYTPINSFEDIEAYTDNYRYVDFKVNPDYMTPDQIRNVAYLIGFANDRRIFDFNTLSQLQGDLIEVAPLNYEKAMEVFNRYYTKDIQKKFIFDYGVDRDRFYYLSGLKEYEFSKEDYSNSIKNKKINNREER